jgi:hypothetical protein
VVEFLACPLLDNDALGLFEIVVFGLLPLRLLLPLNQVFVVLPPHPLKRVQVPVLHLTLLPISHQPCLLCMANHFGKGLGVE